MSNLAQKIQENFESETNDNAVAIESYEVTARRHQLIAKEAEAACCLEGNLNSPDFDVFEEKYGLCCFA